MGNHHSEAQMSTDLVNTSVRDDGNIFKVDNINSQGRKHSSAKIQITNDDLCIRQKHRQSLHIPLETIRRYGLDGSIFILECGRRAPLGQARYAFHCKQARRLVDCLDQRINSVSEQLFNEEGRRISSSTLTNVSSTFDHRHNHRRRTQSDYGQFPSSRSLSSGASFYRNSEPNLSENYFAFDRFNHPDDPSMNYAEFNPVSSTNNGVDHPEQATESNLPTTNTQRTSTSSHQSNVSSNTLPTSHISETSTTMKSYVYIDHEKTNALKDIAQERLQNHTKRIEA